MNILLYVKKNQTLVHNTYMINKNRPFYKVRVEIPNILEIRLKQDSWERVVRLAGLKKKSYSWVVRYCVFRFIKRQNMKQYLECTTSAKKQEKYAIMQRRALEHISEEDLHRHKLCLYGDDELWIRITAGILHCTMSHLVRLALEWNLDELECMAHGKSTLYHRLAFYWLGIKLYSGVELPITVSRTRRIHLIRFTDAEYW